MQIEDNCMKAHTLFSEEKYEWLLGYQLKFNSPGNSEVLLELQLTLCMLGNSSCFC